MKKPVFHIGQLVYHITPESSPGIVNNIMFKYLENYFMYEVAFRPGESSLWYYEHELSENKTFEKL